ncbi:MAG: hypothetical protein R3F10_04625 [Lysobacteraceae bacterium]
MFPTLSFHTCFRHLLVTVALAATALVAAPAQAQAQALTIRCVGTVAQLSAAMDEANASTDTNFIIRVRTGTYDASQAATKFELGASEPDQVIELSGGWSGSGGSCPDQESRSIPHGAAGHSQPHGTPFGTTTTNQGNVAYVNGFTCAIPPLQEQRQLV